MRTERFEPEAERHARWEGKRCGRECGRCMRGPTATGGHSIDVGTRGGKRTGQAETKIGRTADAAASKAAAEPLACRAAVQTPNSDQLDMLARPCCTLHPATLLLGFNLTDTGARPNQSTPPLDTALARRTPPALPEIPRRDFEQRCRIIPGVRIPLRF